MNIISVSVWISGYEVGRLTRAREGLVVFTCNPEWLKRNQHPPLGLDFIRDPTPRRAGTGLPEWFENLLPEPGSYLRARLATVWGLREHDSLGLLVALGLDLPGAVTLKVEESTRHSTYAETSGPVPTPAPREEDRFRFSLAGMQLKFSMAALGQRFSLAASAENRRWIVKMPGAAFPKLPEVEDSTMRWARAAGHNVPPHRVIEASQIDGLSKEWHDGAGRAFAIERFDRRDDGTRVHHEDLCQALALLPIHKYGDTGPRPTSHDGIMRLVNQASGEDEAREHARRVGFVIASGNDDAHLKNWSFEWGSASRPHLSPCYDQVSTITWPPFGWEKKGGPKLALSLGRVRKFASLDRAALIRHAERSGVPWAHEAVIEGIERARHVWSAVKEQAPAEMVAALKIHWSQVPILRALGGLPR